jgi:hypothetical protein
MLKYEITNSDKLAQLAADRMAKEFYASAHKPGSSLVRSGVDKTSAVYPAGCDAPQTLRTHNDGFRYRFPIRTR